MKKASLIAVAFALTVSATPALAGEMQGHQGFVRAELGRGDLNIDDIGSDKDTSYGIGGGYWFSANWGIEGAYNNLYNERFDDLSLKVHNFTVGAVAKKNFAPDGNGFYIGGRTGYGFSRAKVRAWDNDYSYSSDSSSNGLYYGVNVGYDFNHNFGLGLNYTHYKAFSDADVNNLALSGEYRF